MNTTAKLTVENRNPVQAVRGFLKMLLDSGKVGAVLVSGHLPMKRAVMPTLAMDSAMLEGADPFAPAFPLNTAQVLSRLTRKSSGTITAAVLRSCEIRAFYELVKLKQARVDEVLLIGLDCLGTFGNTDYAAFAETEAGSDSTLRFLEDVHKGLKDSLGERSLSPACRSCEHPVPDGADITVGLFGIDFFEQLLLIANSEKGEKTLKSLNLGEAEMPPGRSSAVANLIDSRTDYRDRMFATTKAAVSTMEKLMDYLGNCVSCHNCRVACPVCYCRECVFKTDVFDHEPAQYIRWAKRKGLLKLPTDTVFYHLTRMAHMSTACIGCGQCSNACPNGVPVMELFRTVAHSTQHAFEYVAGMSLDDEPPLSIFKESEFPEVTGGID